MFKRILLVLFCGLLLPVFSQGCGFNRACTSILKTAITVDFLDKTGTRVLPEKVTVQVDDNPVQVIPKTDRNDKKYWIFEQSPNSCKMFGCTQNYKLEATHQGKITKKEVKLKNDGCHVDGVTMTVRLEE